MKFRLTYEGPLRSINRDARPDAPDYMAAHKHAIRRHFHVQLRQLWATDPFLRITDGIEHNFAEMAGITAPGQWRHGASATLLEIATYPKDQFGFHFTPLVHEQFHLACSLDILFLRQDIPGSILHAGDIDNRVKTVIDALRAPRLQNEFLGRNNAQIAPLEGEDPFFVLLEDDKQVSHFSVETDRLLDPPNEDASNVRLIITVELRPYIVTGFNISFA